MMHNTTDAFFVLRTQELKRKREIKEKILECLKHGNIRDVGGEISKCRLCSAKEMYFSPESHAYFERVVKNKHESSIVSCIDSLLRGRMALSSIKSLAQLANHLNSSKNASCLDLCESCLMKLHSYPVPLVISEKTVNSPSFSVEEIMKILPGSKESLMIKESQRKKEQRKNIRELQRRRAKYKVGIIDEQIALNKERYMLAIEQGRDGDMKQFERVCVELILLKKEMLRKV
ncbi:hypothetical protein ENBRE01_2688 [Enteropsectra breve]|nr:hypothetical protein ENBRE01_2688 [Enteropsectra breve]